MGPKIERRLAAILAADMVGYSRLVQVDEAGTLARWKALRTGLIGPLVEDHGGRIVKLTGDGALIEFTSVVEAVDCAIALQDAVRTHATDVADDERIQLRIGVHLGDVVVEDDDLYGDGVNIAARLEGIADAGGICISGTAFDLVQGRPGLAFEDLGTPALKNIDRPVRVYRLRTADAGSNKRQAQAAILARPAVAVLPFTNLSRDPEQEYFADGLTEDIITALAAWRSFPVIARHSTFVFKGTTLDVRKVGEELGARYVLEGSVRTAGNRLRVTSELVDAETGHQVWTEKFDRTLEDVFDIQDELTRRIAAIVAPELEEAEGKKSIAKRTDDLSAWDAYVRGMLPFYLDTCEGNDRARTLFVRAVERDPGYAEAWARLGWTHLGDVANGCTDDRDRSLAKGFEAARRAIALDEASAVAHLCLGTAHIWSDQLEPGLAEAERALELNPSYAHAALAVGNRLDLVGRTEEGIALMEKGLQLNPRDPRRFKYMGYLARANCCLGRHDLALAWVEKAVRLRPEQPDAHFRYAVGLANLGRVEETKAALDEAERLRSGFVESRKTWCPYPDDARNQRFFAGLKALGLMA